MKHQRTLKWLLLTLILFIGNWSVPLSSTAESANENQLEIEDSRGETIVLDGPVDELVVILPSDVEIIYALGAKEQLIGRGEYVNYPEEVQEVPVITSEGEINVEEIINLNPDIALVGQMESSADAIKKLEEVGIPVFVSNAQTILDTYGIIETIGQLVAKEAAADELIEEMQETFETYSQKAQDKDPVTIYYEISPLEYGLYAAASGTFMDELGQLINTENIFADEKGWPEISEEQVIDQSPELIITTSVAPDGAEEIKERAGWDAIPAVVEDRIYQIDADLFSRPGPRLMDAIQQLYEIVYE